MTKLTEYSTEQFRKLAKQQDEFIRTLDGIGDILVYQARRKNQNKSVIEGLQKLNEIVKHFFEIKEKDTGKFEGLLLSQKFIELYKEDEENAKMLLAFNPSKHLVSFSTAINQILRIHEAAIEGKNVEISKFATYHLNWILADLAKEPNNHIFVEQLLQNRAEAMDLAVKNQDVSVYASSIHWYTGIVFGTSAKEFNLEYLTLFNKYFLSTVRYIISQDQTSLFDALVSGLVEGIHVPSYNQVAIWEYGHELLGDDYETYKKIDEEHSVEKRLKELAHSEKELDTKEKRDEWVKYFNELKNILSPFIKGKEKKQRAQQLEANVREYIDTQYKYNELLDVVFSIGSYCLFKKKPQYIKEIWEYKQPPDSDASWVGHDIVPNTIDAVLNFYFRKDLYDREYSFWEGHHGNELYNKKYFLLLLLRALRIVKPDDEGNYKEITGYNLPAHLHVYKLSDIKYSVDNLINIAKDLKGEKENFATLGFDVNELDELFERKLIPFMNIVKTKAQEKIDEVHRVQSISKAKVEEFKKSFLESFYQAAHLREIFQYCGAYEDKTAEKYDGEDTRYGTNIVDDKAAYFDEWHAHYPDWGGSYGRKLGRGEDSRIAIEFFPNFKDVTDELEEILPKFDKLSNVIILINSINPYITFKNSTNYVPKWNLDIKKQPDIRSFEGWYEFNNNQIPVFLIHERSEQSEILIIHKQKMGKLVQYSPLRNDEDPNLKKDIFYMNVEEISKNEAIKEEVLQKQPDWVKKAGDDRQEQEKLISEKVLVQILERFEYLKTEKFEGYRIRVEKG